MRKISKKQAEYLKWRREVAKPAVIERDGDVCACCGLVHRPHDLDEIKGRGSHSRLKRNIDNMQLLGRFPCHHLKTIRKPCLHES